jgi:glycosyltransferase involved in cell wall biosynthesis
MAKKDNICINYAVDIAFPCYNAVLWVDRFLESLLDGVDVPWRVVTRDDGSSDGTLALLKRWRDRLGSSRMLLVEEDGPPRNLGVIGNYNAVLAACSAPWVLTGDPDDIWLRNRIPLTLGALRAAETEAGEQTPLAVCTDAEVIDSDLNPVAPSYWRWSRNMPPRRYTVARVAMDSVALGSTMAINRALLQAALPMSAGAAYQDSWMALVAVSLGRLVVLPEATIRYRRHGANTTKDPFSASLAGALWKLLKEPLAAHERLNSSIRQAARQAGAFASAYADRLSATDANALRALARLPEMSPLDRRIALARHGLWFNSPLKNLGMMVLL